jgi:hypothetical protein
LSFLELDAVCSCAGPGIPHRIIGRKIGACRVFFGQVLTIFPETAFDDDLMDLFTINRFSGRFFSAFELQTTATHP